jgi:Dynactin p62 family
MSVVEYKCTCQCAGYHRIWNLLWCEQCGKTVCDDQCARLELSSYYCRHCLENVASSEASTLRSRCSKCFQCARCTSTLGLSYIASAQKFVLACGVCRWSSQLLYSLDMPMHSSASALLSHFLKLSSSSSSSNAITSIHINTDSHLSSSSSSSSSDSSDSNRSNDVVAFRRQLDTLTDQANHLARQQRLLSNPLLFAHALKSDSDLSVGDSTMVAATARAAVPPVALECQRFKRDQLVPLEHASVHEAWPVRVDRRLPTRVPLATRVKKHCPSCDLVLVVPDLGLSKASFSLKRVACNWLPRISVHASTDAHIDLLVRNARKPSAPMRVSYDNDNDNDNDDGDDKDEFVGTLVVGEHHATPTSVPFAGDLPPHLLESPRANGILVRFGRASAEHRVVALTLLVHNDDDTIVRQPLLITVAKN